MFRFLYPLYLLDLVFYIFCLNGWEFAEQIVSSTWLLVGWFFFASTDWRHIVVWLIFCYSFSLFLYFSWLLFTLTIIYRIIDLGLNIWKSCCKWNNFLYKYHHTPLIFYDLKMASNYDEWTLLIFTQKIEEHLSTRVST